MTDALAFPLQPRIGPPPRLRLTLSERERIVVEHDARIAMYAARVEIIALEIGSKRISSNGFDLRATLARKTIFVEDAEVDLS